MKTLVDKKQDLLIEKEYVIEKLKVYKDSLFEDGLNMKLKYLEAAIDIIDDTLLKDYLQDISDRHKGPIS